MLFEIPSYRQSVPLVLAHPDRQGLQAAQQQTAGEWAHDPAEFTHVPEFELAGVVPILGHSNAADNILPHRLQDSPRH